MIKNIAGALIGVLLFVLTLGGLFYFFESKKVNERPRVVQEKKENKYSVKINGYKGDFPEFINFGFLSDSVTESRLTIGKKLIYDVTYDLDKYGLRKIGDAYPGKAKDHLVFGGCSFTFGQGLPIEQTLPALMEQSLPEFNVYSISFMGRFPHSSGNHNLNHFALSN